MTTKYLRYGALMLLLIATALLPGCSSDDSKPTIQGPTYGPTDFFVSAATGDNTNSGKKNEPFATIQRAVDTAALTGGRIFVAAGDYDENVVLAKGVSLYGGYKDVTFARDTTAVATINGSDVAINVGSADSLTIDRFTINCAAASTPGHSSIGIGLNDSREVTISNNVIHTGNGAGGLSQSKPATPGKSPDGAGGHVASDSGCSLLYCYDIPGGDGGYLPGMSGGHGGHASSAKGDDGEDGLGPYGGAGAVSKGLLGGTGDNGGNGGAGVSVGANGVGGFAIGTVALGIYEPSAGADGVGGDHGSGGGGGGAGGAGLARGAAGGGGGAGAFAGAPGLGGEGGGASIGILISGNSLAIITNNSITTGTGGAGGSGAPGGDPGLPGVGAAGGGGNLWGAAGGRGGNGGTATAGGTGGGGGGGPSVGIIEAAASSTTRSNNSFTLGAGGTGGSSSGETGADGHVADYVKL